MTRLRVERMRRWAMTRTMKAFAIVLTCGSTCSAGSIVESEFIEVGPTESITALFTVPGSGTTVNQYSEFVRVEVSGTGQSKGAQFNDAFYFLSDMSPPENGGLFVSFTGDARSFESDGVSIVGFIAFIDGIGFVDAATPPFNAGNEYDFVVDIGAGLKTVTLGTGDGGLGDNTGQFDIIVTQLAVIPEPSTLTLSALAAIALLSLVAWGRRGR